MYGKLAKRGEYDRGAVIENRVVFNYARGAETFLYFSLHVFTRVFHEDGRVGIRFAHLSLALL